MDTKDTDEKKLKLHEEALDLAARYRKIESFESIHVDSLVTDTTDLSLGQNVFMCSGEGDWGTVVEVTPTGVIVQSDPAYGDELIRFDKNGTACDSSDIDVDRYKDLPLYNQDKEGMYLAPTSCDLDIERVKAIASRYDEKTEIIPRATNVGRLEFRQRFWESFERLKKHSRYSKIPGTSHGPLKLYFHW